MVDIAGGTNAGGDERCRECSIARVVSIALPLESNTQKMLENVVYA